MSDLSLQLQQAHSQLPVSSYFDPAVRGELYLNLVAGQNTDVVHSHLSGDMRQYLVAILELNTKHGVRKRLDNGALKHDGVFFRLGQGGLLNSGGQKTLSKLRARRLR